MNTKGVYALSYVILDMLIWDVMAGVELAGFER